MQVQSQVWEDPLDREVATHSSILAQGIPWSVEPGALQSIGSKVVGHMTQHASIPKHTNCAIYWRRQRHPTPVLLPGESHGWRSLVGCHLWGLTESDTTEVIQQQQCNICIFTFLMNIIYVCVYIIPMAIFPFLFILITCSLILQYFISLLQLCT